MPKIKAALGALKDHKDTKLKALLPNFLDFLGHPNDVVLAALTELRTSVDQFTLAIMVIIPVSSTFPCQDRRRFGADGIFNRRR